MYDESKISWQTYFKSNYANKERWVSYFYQTKLVVQNLKPNNNILEIGVGNGVVAYFLKHAGYQLTTMDINPQLKPDYLQSITDLSNIADNSFDLILCAEVLEHLPYHTFNYEIPVEQKNSQ